MKKTLSGLLSLALAAMVTFASFDAVATGTPEKQTTVSQQLSDQMSQVTVGGIDWEAFANGVACGVGVVAIAAGSSTGIGALAAAALITGTAATCVAAFS